MVIRVIGAMPSTEGSEVTHSDSLEVKRGPLEEILEDSFMGSAIHIHVILQ